MRDINTHCERCIAWLGEEDDNMKDPISFLKFFAQDKHLHEWDGFSEVKRNVDHWQQKYEPNFSRSVRKISNLCWT
jgi:hypothetical protein